jgi:hypothetical protein
VGEDVYEELRMKARQAPHSLHSRAHVLFMSVGMKGWLEAIETIPRTPPPVTTPEEERTLSIPCELEEHALRLLTDIALHTWKEAG